MHAFLGSAANMQEGGIVLKQCNMQWCWVLSSVRVQDGGAAAAGGAQAQARCGEGVRRRACQAQQGRRGC